MPCGVKTSGFEVAHNPSRLSGTLTPSLATVVTLTYSFTAPPPDEDDAARPLAPRPHSGKSRIAAALAPLLAFGLPRLNLPIRQKRDKVAALDMRFQRYRKAEP
jgi:hypothetical protein